MDETMFGGRVAGKRSWGAGRRGSVCGMSRSNRTVSTCNRLKRETSRIR